MNDANQATITAWRRGDRWGIRNHVIVLSAVTCANGVVERIARQDAARRAGGGPAAIPITHPHGCTHLGEDREQVLRTLRGTAGNPNVAGVLVVGLGCESTPAGDIAEGVPAADRGVRSLVIQEAGSMAEIDRRAAGLLAELHAEADAMKPQPAPLAELTVGLECGGSDPLSGITANPAVGLAVDRLVAAGATAILSEIPEMIGAEAALAPRLPDEAVRRELFGRIERYVRTAAGQGCDLRGVNPTPGNIRAGLSTIEEKSLGCIIKGGHSPIVEVVDYAQAPVEKGLVVMDTPGNDPESVTGMAAGGATMVLFTTGVGTPTGHPAVPVVKIASNTPMYQRMADFMDLNAGRAADGTPLPEVADELFRRIVSVANGEPAAAERNACYEFAINRIGATF